MPKILQGFLNFYILHLICVFLYNSCGWIPRNKTFSKMLVFALFSLFIYPMENEIDPLPPKTVVSFSLFPTPILFLGQSNTFSFFNQVLANRGSDSNLVSEVGFKGLISMASRARDKDVLCLSYLSLRWDLRWGTRH